MENNNFKVKITQSTSESCSEQNSTKDKKELIIPIIVEKQGLIDPIEKVIPLGKNSKIFKQQEQTETKYPKLGSIPEQTSACETNNEMITPITIDLEHPAQKKLRNLSALDKNSSEAIVTPDIVSTAQSPKNNSSQPSIILEKANKLIKPEVPATHLIRANTYEVFEVIDLNCLCFAQQKAMASAYSSGNITQQSVYQTECFLGVPYDSLGIADRVKILTSHMGNKGLQKTSDKDDTLEALIKKSNLPPNIAKALLAVDETTLELVEKLLPFLPELIFSNTEKKFYMWNDRYWEYLPVPNLKKRCLNSIKLCVELSEKNGLPIKNIRKAGNIGKLLSIVQMLEIFCYIPDSFINQDASLLCLNNCIFSFVDFQPHSFTEYKYCYITTMLNCNYNFYARSEVLNRFLCSIMVDRENVEFLQTIFGYALMGNPIHQVGFLLEGSGSNGKSTLLDAIDHLLGNLMGPLQVSYFTSSAKEDCKRPDPATYAVKGKRIIYTSEGESSSFLNEGKIKKFIDGLNLIGRPPYGQQVTFKNNATLFFDTNYLPHFKDGGYSIRRRFMVVPFPVTFTKDVADPYLLQKLKRPDVQEALLLWLLCGAARAYYVGEIIKTPRVHEATEKFFDEEDTISQFLKYRTVKEPGAITPFSELYNAYVDFCRVNCYICKSVNGFSKTEAIKSLPEGRGKFRYKYGIKLI